MKRRFLKILALAMLLALALGTVPAMAAAAPKLRGDTFWLRSDVSHTPSIKNMD